MKQPYAFHFGVGTCRGEMREVPGGSALSTFHLLPSTSARQSRRAFTLIELMGVMAIIGILAAVTLPSMISKIESARTENEDANLQEIARALTEGIKRQGQFPDPAGSWTSIAQNYTSLGANALANALPNNDAPNNNPRRIIFSDALTAYLGGTFTQPAMGRPAPAVGASLIIYILSSSKDGVPLSTGVIPPADIANWTKTFNPTNGYIPAPTSVFGVGNERRGEFFHVKAMDVRSLFCAVTLTDFPIPTRGQTTSSGSGFTPNTPYQGQAAGCSFNFIAPAPAGAVVVGFETDPPTVTTNVAVGSKTMIPRTGAPTTSGGVIPPADRNIASLNARNTLAANLLNGPYAAASGATNAAAALAAITGANINTNVSAIVPKPTGLANLEVTYNSAKVASDAAQAAAEAEKIRDPANETAPDNATLDSTAAAASQATASALAALQTAQAASSAQLTANANALQDASANAIRAADTEFKSGGTPQSIASAAANAAANAAAAQVVTSPATFSMTIDQPPWWLIGTLAGQQMPIVGNSQIFYVIKGTALTLYAAGAALPAAPILTVQINADSKFEYFNGAWTRVD